MSVVNRSFAAMLKPTFPRALIVLLISSVPSHSRPFCLTVGLCMEGQLRLIREQLNLRIKLEVFTVVVDYQVDRDGRVGIIVLPAFDFTTKKGDKGVLCDF